MRNSLTFAVQTICASATADFILYDSFTTPGSSDVLIIKDREILLYTLKSQESPEEVESAENVDNYEPSNVGVSFVCKLCYYGTARGAKVLKNAIFWECTSSSDDTVGFSTLCTSAVSLCFDNGRVVSFGYDPKTNGFITLSMHALSQQIDNTCIIKDNYFAVYSASDWHFTGECTESGEIYRTFAKQFVIVLCYDEKILNVLSLQSTFRKPMNSHNCLNSSPFEVICNVTNHEGDSELLHIILVPWLHVSQYYTLNVDTEYGFSDGRYFVRGLEFSSNHCILGLLVATMPEAIATHATYDPGDIGGKSLICIKLDLNKNSNTLVNRVDGLPLDVDQLDVIQGEHAVAFVFLASDFIIWINLMDPLIYWQFLSCSAVLNHTVETSYDKVSKYKYLDYCHLDVDMDRYNLTITKAGLCGLVPKYGGDCFIGKVLESSTFGIVDIAWLKIDKMEWQVNACHLEPTLVGINLLYSGSGTDLSLLDYIFPQDIMQFDFNIDDYIQNPHVIHVPDLHMSIPCQNKMGLELLQEILTGNEIEKCHTFQIRNHGVLKDAKNIPLPSASIQDGTSKRKSGKATVTFESNIGIGQVQAILAICDESRLTVAMPKIPLELVTQVQVHPYCQMLTNANCSNNVITWADGGTGLLTCTGNEIEFTCPVLPQFEVDDEDNNGNEQISDLSDLLYNCKSITFGTIGNNVYLQVTSSDVVFLQGPKMTLIQQQSIQLQENGHNYECSQATIIGTFLILLYQNGTCMVHEAKLLKKNAKLELMATIEDVLVINGYENLNNFCNFGQWHFTLYKTNDSFHCIRLPDLYNVFSISNIKQVHANLYTSVDPIVFKRTKRRKNEPSSVGQVQPQSDYITRNLSIVKVDEHVIDIVLVNISIQDHGPTLIIFMTARPMLIYRSCWLNERLCFQILMHEFVATLPSTSIKGVDIMNQGRKPASIVCLNSENAQDEFVLVAYPRLFYGNGFSDIVGHGAIADRMAFIESWKNFKPPLLRLSAFYNRLYIHELVLNHESSSSVVSTFAINTSVNIYGLVTLDGNFQVAIPCSLFCKLSNCIQKGTEQSNEPKSRFCHVQRRNGSMTITMENLIGTVEPCYQCDLAELSFGLGDFRGTLVAASHRDYYLIDESKIKPSNWTNISSECGLGGKMIAIVVQESRNNRGELLETFNERINLQLKQLATENLPPGTQPLDLIVPNKQIGISVQTIDALAPLHKGGLREHREIVLLFHIGNLSRYVATFEMEAMTTILSMTFTIVGSREYLCLGTCTRLGEHVESSGDVILVDLQPIFNATFPNEESNDQGVLDQISPANNVLRLSKFCKKTFAGPITFMSSLDSDFNLLQMPNFDLSGDLEKLSTESSQHKNWVAGHFKPNSDTIIHSVGQRLFVHELSGKEFVRGAFVEVPQCISTACIFDKFIITGDVNRGIQFFMYHYDSQSDSRAICKISNTNTRIDLSVIACAPLVNKTDIGILASDYFGNLMLLHSSYEVGGTLDIVSACKLPNRLVHFTRRPCNQKQDTIEMIGWTSGGSVLRIWMPDEPEREHLKLVQSTLQTMAPPFGISLEASSIPTWTNKTSSIALGITGVLQMDLVKRLGFYPSHALSRLKG
ncbi:bifunctional WD40-YVTN repeat-like-containing domain superfamily/Cleavage-polyadenylation specificity factor [Babesia duncani]|uniref:Bifunctional WD40-YVTN repeat-like-containing domain superfamily/Cleavage-polyadenylation specificity factor n=1 Tax=Babesia duncani TaxID=323732 RepID=A0AAD9PGV8_9APIC|nr:bifunctional WD40-YVTN repeat-like-containing domain superfamily/Cleavage-polyadenylation specificity factor [Babesia duncani]KAK2194617.1 bifunctional WD40-YVTN repeat-like-containing domain superfamily/Cleavage-polyadenylation specificity factor [Babesia duncani]KAK2195245.1 bifunctional WD40-YVTN repeat-like-containing domain superfamily/Cleavage-polyadenylation specificity factor [Babesia duncani]